LQVSGFIRHRHRQCAPPPANTQKEKGAEKISAPVEFVKVLQ
jgi:hypothetical protein